MSFIVVLCPGQRRFINFGQTEFSIFFFLVDADGIFSFIPTRLNDALSLVHL